MSFTGTIKSKSKSRRYDWEAHHVLNDFSSHGLNYPPSGNSDNLSLEAAALRILSLSARDTYRLEPIKISNFKKVDGLEDSEVRLAGISMSRNDIGYSENHEKKTAADRQKKFRFFDDGSYCFTKVNDQADDPYNRQEWEQARLLYLDRCIEQKVNIVCLGEFDYPPCQHGSDDSEFEIAIQRKIMGLEFPMFVLAGTRHEKENSPEKCANVAKIFVNDNLKNTVADHLPPNYQYQHEKVVSATKAGEILSPPSRIGANYYDTALGRIAVLICVDAYNPTVIFSLLDQKIYNPANSFDALSDRIDFILVPAYNFSPKLYYSCQILSLLCRCTVLLVDACSHWSKYGDEKVKRKEVELFYNGRSFSDIRDEDSQIGEELSVQSEPYLRAWSLNRHYLTSESVFTERAALLPSFDNLHSFIDATDQHDE